MSTRSRRSAGDGTANSTLNPAMIGLFPQARLKQELEHRGLDTRGSVQDLQERLRLSSMMANGGSGIATNNDATPKTPKRRGVKRKIKEEVCVEDEGPMEAKKDVGQSKAGHEDRAAQVDLTRETWLDSVKRLPAQTTAASEFVLPTTYCFLSLGGSPTLSEFTISTNYLKDPDNIAAQKSSPPVKAKKPKLERKAMEDKKPDKATTKPVVTADNGLPTKPASAEKEADGIKDGMKSTSRPRGNERPSQTPKFNLKLRLPKQKGSKERTPAEPAPANDKAKVSSKQRDADAATPVRKSSVRLATATPVAPLTKLAATRRSSDIGSSKPVAVENKEKQPTSKVPNSAQPKLSTGAKPASSTTPLSAAKPTPAATAQMGTSSNSQLTINNSTSHHPTVAAAQPKQQVSSDQPVVVNLFDSIFDNQDKLLAEKFKSEQDKSFELQRIELKRRKANAVSGGGVEKIPTERGGKNQAGSNSEMATLHDFEEGDSVPRPRNRDPLGLGSIDEDDVVEVSHAMAPSSRPQEAVRPRAPELGNGTAEDRDEPKEDLLPPRRKRRWDVVGEVNTTTALLSPMSQPPGIISLPPIPEIGTVDHPPAVPQPTPATAATMAEAREVGLDHPASDRTTKPAPFSSNGENPTMVSLHAASSFSQTKATLKKSDDMLNAEPSEKSLIGGPNELGTKDDGQEATDDEVSDNDDDDSSEGLVDSSDYDEEEEEDEDEDEDEEGGEDSEEEGTAEHVTNEESNESEAEPGRSEKDGSKWLEIGENGISGIAIPPPPPIEAAMQTPVMDITCVAVSGQSDALESNSEIEIDRTQILPAPQMAAEGTEENAGAATISANPSTAPESETSQGPAIEEGEATNGKTTDEVDGSDLSDLIKHPKALLQKASDILKRYDASQTNIEKPQIQIEQIDLGEDYPMREADEEPKVLDFHGEPVPEEDDEELFEQNANPSQKRGRRREAVVVEEEPMPDHDFIELDFFNSDLNIKASATNKWLIDPENSDGFALMWGGVRSNYGYQVPEDRTNVPKLCFQIKVVEQMSLKHLPFEEANPYDTRIGWSAMGTSVTLMGESIQSYAYSSLGKKASFGTFTNYGETFQPNDIITTILDLHNSQISYRKNGVDLGVAFTDLDFEPGTVVLPHIATKNCKVLVNFGLELPESENVEQWKATKPEGVMMVGEMKNNEDMKCDLVGTRRPPDQKADCTIIVMVGLPGAGKTSWVRRYLRDHPDEHWCLISTDTVMSAMSVNGIPRQRVHQGRWDMVMGLTAKAVNRSLQMACRRRHNYILDSTNVSKEARRKKLAQFDTFQRKCVVIIPPDEELEKRLARQARQEGGGGQVPAEAMLELKATFAIPCTEAEPYIEDVLFIEPQILRVNEAIEQVRRYNEEARPWLRQHPTRTQRPRSLISDNRGTANQWLGIAGASNSAV